MYWAVVVVISVFGTLITDNMTDHYNVPLTTSTIVFSIVLAAICGVPDRRNTTLHGARSHTGLGINLVGFAGRGALIDAGSESDADVFTARTSDRENLIVAG